MLIVALVAVLVWYLIEGRAKSEDPAAPVDGQCEIVMIDIGQGDAFLVRTPEGCALFDTGPYAGRSKLGSYLKGAGIEKIDYLILPIRTRTTSATPIT